jgi:hypothetical protein
VLTTIEKMTKRGSVVLASPLKLVEMSKCTYIKVGMVAML